MLSRALDLNSHDLYANNGRIAIVNDVNEVTQHIKTRLLLFLGEWVLDLNAGTPWFESILVKPADLQEIESIIKNIILTTPNVNELITFDMSYTSSNRSFFVEFSCNTSFGVTDETEVTLDV